MRRKVTWIIVLCIFICALSGCGGWMHGEYSSVEPYLDQTQQESPEKTSVSSYEELQNTLTELVRAVCAERILTTTAFSADIVESYMEKAVDYIMNSYAYGAYAVEQIVYDTSINEKTTEIAVEISYRKSKTDIEHIGKAEDMQEAYVFVEQALDNYSSRTVFFVKAYEETDFQQLVEEYGNLHPDKLTELPQVTLRTYPNQGDERILELWFTYETGIEKLRSMQAQE